MLIPATKEQILPWRQQFYELAMDPSRSSYPLFSDGTKTREEFFRFVNAGALGEQNHSLFYTEGDRVLGLFQYFTIPEDCYLQLCGCYIFKDLPRALEQLMDHIGQHHKGCELYFGFSHKNQMAIAWLRDHGFSLLEQSWHDVMNLSDYAPQPMDPQVRKLDRAHFEEFRQLHQVDDTTYWNSQRLWESFDRWNIYLYYEGDQPVGAIYETDGEIFGLDYLNGLYREDVFRALLGRVLRQLKDQGHQHLIFLNEDDTHEAVLTMGFQCAGQYQLYHKVLD